MNKWFVRFKLPVFISLVLIMALAITTFVLADNISNNLDGSVDAVAEVMPLAVGGANGTTQLFVVPTNGDGKNGCNLTGSTTLVVSVSSSDTSVATVSPSSITFESCGDTPLLTITPHNQGSATISISQTSNNTGGTFNLAPATFTVNVAPPPNTPPQISITGVTGGASYEFGSVPAVTCSVTDAEDGNSSFAASLSVVTGSLSAYGLGEQTASCSYTDKGGLTASASVTYGIVDTTAPVFKNVQNVLPVSLNGSSSAVVDYGFTVTDNVDPNPTVSCTPASGSSFNLGDTPVSCTAADFSTNSASASFTVRVTDPTAPVITPTVSGTLGQNGWYTSSVSISWAVSDPESAATPDDGCQPITLTADQQEQTYTCTAASAGGSSSQSVSVKIDQSAPEMTGIVPSGGAKVGDFYTEPFTVTFQGEDGVSGIASCTTDAAYAGPDTTDGKLTGTCTDMAGNSSSVDFPFKYDATAPTITFKDRTPYSSGSWNNTDVTVRWDCADAASGVVDAVVSQTLSDENAGQSATGVCVDNVGHTAQATVDNINIDKTAPTAVIGTPVRDPDNNGWYNKPLSVSFDGQDALSGIASCSKDVSYTSGDSASASVSGTCEDNAGNTTSAAFAFKYDATAPALSGKPTTDPNSAGWYNQDVSIAWTCTDNLSGIPAGTCPVNSTISDEGAGKTAAAEVHDEAGNVAKATSSPAVNIDKTQPVIAFSTRTAPNTFNWNNGSVTVEWSCTDALSGEVSKVVSQTVTGEGENQSATGTCTDKAGNTSTDTQGGINIDKTGPTLKPSISPMPVLLNGVHTASAGATDLLSGVASQSCGAVVTSSVGSKSLTCSATDKAGNSSQATLAYTVGYRFDGFLQPINDTAHQQVDMSVFKAGSTVPVKFQLKDANGNIVQTTSAIWITPSQGSKTNQPVDESVYSLPATSGNLFRWDATAQQYIYNWNTKGYAAGYVYRIGVQLDDTTTQVVYIALR